MDEVANQDGTEVDGGEAALDGFRTVLDVFSGPMDLLLHLVRRNEVDVLEIPIARITDQYLEVLRTMQMFDVNMAAEFLVMAATLMDIKSRSLLPEVRFEDEEPDDARDQLVRRLLEYKQFKEAAEALEALRRRHALKFARVPVVVEEEPEPFTPESLLENVDIWGLVSAYAEVVHQIELQEPQHIVYDDVPVSAYMDEIMDRLAQRGGASGSLAFLEFLETDRGRARTIGVFLALLELARRHQILLEQRDEDRSHILITLAPPSPESDDQAGQ